MTMTHQKAHILTRVINTNNLLHKKKEKHSVKIKKEI